MTEKLLLSEKYVVVIHTDQYAEHFVEDLCGYCTGFVGENCRGSKFKFIDMYYDDFGLVDDEINGDDGETAIEKNMFYGYVADHQDEMGRWVPAAVWLNPRYGANSEGKYLVLTESNYDVYNFPAPLSVGIFFDVEPTIDQIKTIKERAVKFFEIIYPRTAKDGHTKEVKIEGFSLIKHTKYGEETTL